MNKKWIQLRRIHLHEKITILAVAAVVSFLWGGTTAEAGSDDVKLDLTKGSIEIGVDGYRQGDGEQKDGPEDDGSYIITSNGEETGNVVTVVSGKGHAVTFNEVNIRTGGAGGYNPLYIAPKAKVKLTLKGKNILFSEGYTAVAVPEEASVEISAVNGGTLEAWTGAPGVCAGIGGTSTDNRGNAVKNGGCGTVEINSGVISATSIGGKNPQSSSGTGYGTLSSDGDGTAWIDAGSVEAGRSEFESGVIFDGYDGKVYGSYTLNKEGMAVPFGKTLTVTRGSSLTVPGKYPLNLEGNLVNNGTLKIGSESSLTGNGGIGGSGEFYIFAGLSENMFQVPDKMLYGTGEDHTEYVKKYVKDSIQVSGSVVVRGVEFTRVDDGAWEMSISPSKVASKGTYTVTFTDPQDSSNKVQKTFEVLDAGELAGLTLTAPPKKTQYTYGERFSKEGMTAAVTYSSGAVKTVANNKIKVKDGNLNVGQAAVTLSYQENGKEVTCTVGISVSPKEIDLTKINWEEKTVSSYVYDGTEKTLDFKAEMPEGLKVAIGGTNSAVNAGVYTATIDFFLEEGCEGNYVLTGIQSLTKEWSIAPKQLEWNTGDIEVAGNTRDENVYVYGELAVEGLIPEDAKKEVVQTRFPTDKVTGIHNQTAGDEQEIALVWKDENDRYSLGEGETAGNYALPQELPVIPAVINTVDITIAPPELDFGEDRTYRLDIENGISRVPDGLKSSQKFDFPSEIEKSLINAVMKKGVGQTYADAYDLELMSKGKDETEWRLESGKIDSAGGLTMTIRYPRGITKHSYDGVVAYIYPRDMGGERAGTIIYPEVTKTDDGIEFVVSDPAPVAVGWKKVEQPTGAGKFWESLKELFGGGKSE